MARNPAPIDYEDLRVRHSTMRALAAALFISASLYGLIAQELVSAWAVLGPAIFVLVDALIRRRVESPALPPLLVDITAIWVAMSLGGGSPSVQAAAFIYVMLAALLLLSLPVALVTLLYALAWAGIAAWASAATDGQGLISRLVTTEEPSPDLAAAFDLFATMVFIAMIAMLLFGAVGAMRRSATRNRTALEAERRAVRLKNEFVSMVSHELRTPLTAIGGFTETLRENWQNFPEQEIDEFLMIIRRETQHLGNLVEDILVIPRLEAGQLRLSPTELDLAQKVYEVADLIFQDGSEYAVNVPPDVIVVADPVRLKQVLRNLLENAEKYGGDQVLIDGEPYGDGMYTVVVADNGPGVPEGDRTRIFEHFEQVTRGDARLEQGVGLGLPIARKLVREMGGDLWHEPRFPVGSRFCFTVAAKTEPQPADEPDIAAKPVHIA